MRSHQIPTEVHHKSKHSYHMFVLPVPAICMHRACMENRTYHTVKNLIRHSSCQNVPEQSEKQASETEFVMNTGIAPGCRPPHLYRRMVSSSAGKWLSARSTSSAILSLAMTSQRPSVAITSTSDSVTDSSSRLMISTCHIVQTRSPTPPPD